MINARFMYLRPGNLFKDFVVESNTQVVTASGRVVNDRMRFELGDTMVEEMCIRDRCKEVSP